MTEYKQFTEKYRPKKFKDVVGQKVAVGTLESMILKGTVNPTIMLSGPFGTGKTTLGRMIARYVNCTTKDACGTCKSCLSMDSGTHTDVVEINAANARGIDDMRALVASSEFTPRSNYRVFIVDECFPYETQVMVDYDKCLPIGEVFANSSITHVLAYDLESKQILKKKIVNRFSRPYSDNLIRIKLIDNNYFKCTQRQEIYVAGKGYTPADEIMPGDLLIEYQGDYSPVLTCDFCDDLVGKKFLGSHIMQKHRENTTHVAFTESRLGSTHTQESIEKISKSHLLYHKTPEGMERDAKFAERQKGLTNTIFTYMTPAEVSSYMSKRNKLWRSSLSEEEIARRTEIFINAPKHNKLHPNRKETAVIDLNISGLKFVGNGKIFITFTRDDGSLWRKNPDFIYKENNKVKKIIEVMDFEYWHTREEASDVIRYYKKVGYDCLIIDAARIPKKLNEVRGEIEAFINNHYVEVLETKIIPKNRLEPRMVYDLEVEDTHNFFVVPGIYKNGKASYLTKYGKPVLVHNCQQLTPQAAQALLKPLEEPPKRTLWILCTTDPQKILPAIRSRAQQIKIQAVPVKSLVNLMSRVCEEEKLAFPEKALEVLATMADGHPRNALMLLEQVQHYLTSNGGMPENLEEVLPKIVEEIGSLPPELLVSKYIHSLLDANYRSCCNMVRKAENPEYFLHLSFKYIRNLLHEMAGVSSTPELASFLSQTPFKRSFTQEHLIKLLDLHLNGLEQAKRYSVDSCDVLDVVVLKSLEVMQTSPLRV